MKVAIGSTNPAKIEAVEDAFKKVWPKKKFKFIPISVQSGVSRQPRSDEECIRGARNRAKKAIDKTKADLGVGLEGGIHKIGRKWFDSGWIVVIDKKGTTGIGCSIKMETPPKMMKTMDQKQFELGEVDDFFFKIKNSKQKQGHFGLMTNNAIKRSHAYSHAVISALTRFIHPELF